MYHIFSVGVKTNISLLVSGRKALLIGLAGLLLPIFVVLVLLLLLGDHVARHLSGGVFWAFMATQISCTPLAVIHRYLSDFQLLNTDVGRLALTIGMLNDVAGVVLVLVVDITVAGEMDFTKMPLQIGTLLLLVLVCVFFVRPLCFWIIRRTPQGKPVEQGYVVLILLATLNLGIWSNMTGLSVLEGPLIFGLAIPSGPPLGATVLEKIELVNNNLMLPLLFAAIGQRLNLLAVYDWRGLWVVVLLVVVSRLMKLLGTLVSALGFRFPFREALSVGLVLCTRGLVDIMPYYMWESLGLIDVQSYAAFVMVGVIITTITSPIVKRMSMQRSYRPHVRRTIQHSKPQTELRLLACIHEKENVPPTLNLLELANATLDNPICVYVMHLVELVGRATPMLMAHMPDTKSSVGSSIFSVFHNYERQRQGSIVFQPFTSISPYKTVHDDICGVALQKKVSLIILPFQKQQLVPGSTYMVDNALQIINPNVLARAPCSVGVLVDRSRPGGSISAVGDANNLKYSVGVLFFGGPDDRESLSFAARMAQHPSVTLVVTRFLTSDFSMDNMDEKGLDDEMVGEFRVKMIGNKKVRYEEIIVHDEEQTVGAICSMHEVYDLIVVGRNQWFDVELAHGLSLWRENPELGAIGDMCCSPEFFGGKASVLVMQQQAKTAADVEEWEKGSMKHKDDLLPDPRLLKSDQLLL
ncbi:hypothetical protein ACLOJK_031365 [Asimina triloba]